MELINEYKDKLVEVEEKVKLIMISHMNLDVKPENINVLEEYFLEAYGFNSVDALELLLRIEQEFDIEISDENLNAELVKTVRSISQYILSALGENS